MGQKWITVCSKSDLTINTGVCALVNGEAGDEQVALFQSDQNEQVFAVSNYDPIGEANVLSRGLIGSVGDELVVASPLYKQHFNLKTGVCLEDPSYQLKTYASRIEEGQVQLLA